MEKILYHRCITQKISRLYSAQKSHSKKRGHNPPEYSKQEFLEWCLKDNSFNLIFKSWVKSNFKKDLAPSIDRIDDYNIYSFKNIRVCTFRENYLKSHSDMKNGINNKQSKAVLQFDLDGNFIKEYHSCSQAGREIKISQGSISSCCNKNRKQAGGYKWKFKI